MNSCSLPMGSSTLISTPMPSPRWIRNSERSARELARKLAIESQAEALACGKAVIVGNRAGIVEWTDEAWSRLTGFPLCETLDKPISHFLHRAGLEVELVDFVAQHFLEGRSCTLQSAFDTFDGRRIQVHLQVEPQRDAAGDIDRFVAVASEISQCDALAGEASSGAASRPPEVAPLSTGSRAARQGSIPTSAPPSKMLREAVPLESVVLGVLDRLTQSERGSAFFELIGAPEKIRVEVEEPLLDEVIRVLVCSAFANARERSGYVSVLTGLLDGQRFHRSKVHPISIVPEVADARPYPYLEIHDTGPHLDRPALDRIRRRCPAKDSRERALAQASELVGRMNARIHLDSTPGCGTQVLIAFTNDRPSEFARRAARIPA